MVTNRAGSTTSRSPPSIRRPSGTSPWTPLIGTGSSACAPPRPTTGAQVKAFRNKEEGGHDQPWLRFLAGDNPTYPEEILQAAYANVCRRLALIAQDDADLSQVYIHHWQEHNPVVTEALVQLTLGAPQIVYNGGLLHCRLRYYDLGNGEGSEVPIDRVCLRMWRRWSRRWRRIARLCIW